MRITHFDYPLPEELIAQEPAPRRDASRLLVVDCAGEALRHRRFYELPGLLRPGDCLVINDSRVIPARLFAHRAAGGGRVEILLLRRLGGDGAGAGDSGNDGDPGNAGERQEWVAMVRPGRRAREGDVLLLDGGVRCTVLARREDGTRRLLFEGDDLERRLRALGRLPLPPYIRRELRDPDRYQTVYAAHEGSVAAPTAGLHFTPELLAALEARGVTVARLTLHVGPGTFRPVRAERVEDHRLDPERFRIPEETAAAIAACRRRGGRVVAVGTTVTRALESAAAPDGTVAAGEGETDLFILPGHRFRVVDVLLTNLHLPRSTLLMLVCAFCGYQRAMAAYREAVRCRYRFFSFGDAMLLMGGGRCGHSLSAP